MNFFIADPNFGRENILAYENMPFSDIMEHDVEIKYRWNQVVGDDDDVYIIGNFSWLSVNNSIRLLKTLKGRKHLIKAGHDQVLLREKEVRDLFVEVRDYKELVLADGTGIVMFASPIPFYNNAERGWIHLHGGLSGTGQNMIEHLKCQMADLSQKPVKIINVSASMPYIDFTPRTVEELRMLYSYGKKGGKKKDAVQRRATA